MPTTSRISVITKWILHWTSALLVLGIMLTALPLSFLSELRPGQDSWLHWHVVAGWTIGLVTLLRLARYGLARDFPAFSMKGWQFAKDILLGVVVILIVTGFLAFRNVPLRAPLEILGLFEVPVLFKDSHSLHFTSIQAHRWLSYLSVFLLALHIGAVMPKARRFAKCLRI